MDNDGRYRNAPNERIRKSIFEGGSEVLEQAIQRHQKELDKLLQKLAELDK